MSSQTLALNPIMLRLVLAGVAVIVALAILQLAVKRSFIEKLVRKNIVTATTGEQMYKPIEILGVILSILVAAYIVAGDPVLAAAIIAIAAAIAVSLWPILSNIFAYYVILLSHRVRSGDLVSINGVRGRVVRVTPIHTALRSHGGRLLLIPNKLFLEKSFEKLSSGSTRVRLRIKITLPRNMDKAVENLEATEAKLRELLQERGVMQRGQEPTIIVNRLEPGAAILDLEIPLPTPQPRIPFITSLVEDIARVLEGLDPQIEVLEEIAP